MHSRGTKSGPDFLLALFRAKHDGMTTHISEMPVVRSSGFRERRFHGIDPALWTEGSWLRIWLICQIMDQKGKPA